MSPTVSAVAKFPKIGAVTKQSQKLLRFEYLKGCPETGGQMLQM